MSETARKPYVSEEELFEMEAGFMEAVKERDMTYLDRMLGENFVLTTGRAGAEVRSGQEWRTVSRHATTDGHGAKL